MHPEFATVDGVKLRHRIHHRPGAEKLLLVNSLPQSLRCWDAHWADLGATFELLAIDLPGFGLSECRPEMLSPSAEGEFLATAIAHFAWEGCIAIGPDIGVPVVLSLAQTNPALLSGIVIMDGPGYYEPVFSVDLRWTMKYGWFRKLAVMTYQPEIYLRQVFKRGYRKFTPAPEAYDEYVAVNRDRGSFERTVSFLATYEHELTAIGNGLPAMTVPTLIAWGEDDVFVPVENGRELARRIPGSRLHVFAGCGHFSHEDAGDEFSAVLRSWLAAALASSTADRPQ